MVLDKKPNDAPRHVEERQSSRITRIPASKETIIGVLILIGIVLMVPIIFLIISFSRNDTGEDVTEEEGIEIFASPYVAGELIVEMKDVFTAEEITNLNSKFEELGVVSQEKVFEGDDSELKNYYLLKFKEGVDLEEAREELLNLEEIQNAAPNYIFEVDITPEDPLYRSGDLWGLDRINMPNAWEITQGSANVVVAVIDTGIDNNHPDLIGRSFVSGYDFSTCNTYQSDTSSVCVSPKNADDDPTDDHGHGTHVAGTIAATSNNSVGIAGVDWNATLMAVKTMGRSSRGELLDIERGIQYAINNGADVINMSLSAGVNCNDTQARSLKAIITRAVEAGIVVVAAAGNGVTDQNGITKGVNASNSTPASCDGVITVGATDQSNRRTSFSNFGDLVDVAAPGMGIQSLNIGGGYSARNGTSMAAPHVAGVVSLLLSQNPNLSPQQVESCIINNSDPLPSQGIGPLLNAFNVLNVCSGLPPITPSPNPVPTTAIVPTITLPPVNNPASIPYFIEGEVIIDANGNGVKDSSDSGYPGGQVTLSGNASQTLLTDSSGNFVFSNLTPGNYNLSLTIDSQVIPFSQTITLSAAQHAYSATFILSAGYAQPGQQNTPLPTPRVQIQPLPTITKMPTPTPAKTYTCRENDNDYTPQGTIQLGVLICEPN